MSVCPSKLLDELGSECAKYGALGSIQLPREGAGRGKAYLEYAAPAAAAAAAAGLRGRKFGGVPVVVASYDESLFARGHFE